MSSCYRCGANFDVDKIHFGDQCEGCGYDMHVCKNCNFFDRSAANECREPSAEKVMDKEKRNYCDYFTKSSSANGLSDFEKKKKELLDAAENLFKKK